MSASPSRFSCRRCCFVTLLLFAVLACSCFAGCALKASDGSPPDTTAVISAKSSEELLGIEALSMRLSAAGYMLDFRYRAVDPERAAILFDRQIKPYLIHESTGARFLIPAPAKVGPLRQTTNKPVAGKHYFMMFANPGQYVKAGDKVTVVFGEYKIEHLTVE